MSGSAYICEVTFSIIKQMKRNTGNRLLDATAGRPLTMDDYRN